MRERHGRAGTSTCTSINFDAWGGVSRKNLAQQLADETRRQRAGWLRVWRGTWVVRPLWHSLRTKLGITHHRNGHHRASWRAPWEWAVAGKCEMSNFHLNKEKDDDYLIPSGHKIGRHQHVVWDMQCSTTMFSSQYHRMLMMAVLLLPKLETACAQVPVSDI